MCKCGELKHPVEAGKRKASGGAIYKQNCTLKYTEYVIPGRSGGQAFGAQYLRQLHQGPEMEPEKRSKKGAYSARKTSQVGYIIYADYSSTLHSPHLSGKNRFLICMICMIYFMVAGGRRTICMIWDICPGLVLYCADRAQHFLTAG